MERVDGGRTNDLSPEYEPPGADSGRAGGEQDARCGRTRQVCGEGARGFSKAGGSANAKSKKGHGVARRGRT